MCIRDRTNVNQRGITHDRVFQSQSAIHGRWLSLIGPLGEPLVQRGQGPRHFRRTLGSGNPLTRGLSPY